MNEDAYRARRNTVVEDYPEEIGMRLRRAREAAGLELEDVAHQTRIPVSVLRALEAEDFSVFSSPTYAKSFLSQYSAFVGVDASDWLDSFEPVNFVGEEVVAPLLASRPPPPVEAPPAPRQSGGALAGALLLAMTALLLYGAVRGYRFLDEKFGAEAVDQAEEAAGPGGPEEEKTSPVPPVVLVPEIPATPPAEEDEEPPPRAIIVRDY